MILVRRIQKSKAIETSKLGKTNQVRTVKDRHSGDTSSEVIDKETLLAVGMVVVEVINATEADKINSNHVDLLVH